ncbi:MULTISPECIES: PPE domain-containing protein [Amycolatopsis]|uniref:PPE family protein n=2 Tax=Amycolatopsis TaxID=1813 RepID=A0A1I4CZ19_9PSEU|nr:PPE domain-containing protein [Amycolatopsis sacchari]SFK85659.1 PPE family protein [Amycolatopsis sacchari]
MTIPEPVRRYESRSHEELAREVAEGNDPAAAGQLGARWAELGTRLRESAQALESLADRSGEAWQGPAAEAVRATLAKAAAWSDQATEVSRAVAGAVSGQAEIAARARAEMPPPVSYDPVAMIRESAGDVVALVGLSDRMARRREESEAARRKAIDVMAARDAALRASVPDRVFEAPPELT